jgi:hypothetical protein
MVITRQGFSQVVANSFAGLGFSAEAPTVIEFPHVLFWTNSDLTPIRENIDKVVFGLTKWEPKRKTKGVVAQPKVTVEGRDIEEALGNMNSLFLRNMWSDGLALYPPTEKRVQWILTGTNLSPDTLVGRILPRGGIATVESLAVNLAMAGGRPEYLPVLIAAVKAMVNPEFVHQSWNSTTNNVYPALIVNGPIARQIRVNSGYGCLGPDPIHPANGSIGRALRLILQNMGGAIPGSGTMSIYGGANRYTNIVFAEDEAGSPWAPLSADMKFPKGSNVVTMVSINGTINMMGTDVSTPETAEECLRKYAWNMKVPNFNTFDRPNAGVVLMANETAKGLAEFGWTKEKIKNYLWENSKLPLAELQKATATTTRDATSRWRKMTKPGADSLPITPKPDGIIIVVAGGAQAGHGYWMQGMGHGPLSAEIELPANWNDLLKRAEADLGPVPAN